MYGANLGFMRLGVLLKGILSGLKTGAGRPAEKSPDLRTERIIEVLLPKRQTGGGD
jgi:hypothetical protein